MKKENFVIGLIGVAVVFFLLGRFSVSTTETPANPEAKVDPPATTDGGDNADKPGDAEPALAKAAPAAAAAANNAGKAARTGKPAAAVANAKPARAAAPARKVAGSLNVMESPRKGAAVAKVTIMEISDFQ